MTVTVTDALRQTTSAPVELDGQWQAHISVWSDNLVSTDDVQAPDCTGKCTVRVVSGGQVAGRMDNKVKLLTVSVRPCIGSE